MEVTQGLRRHGVSLLSYNQENRVTRKYETFLGSMQLPHLAQRKKTCHCWWLFSAVFLADDWHIKIRVNKLETLLIAPGFSTHNALAQQMTFYCFQKVICLCYTSNIHHKVKKSKVMMRKAWNIYPILI